MKKIIIIMLIMGGVTNLFAQISTHSFKKGKAFDKHPKLNATKQNSPEKKMPLFDLAPLLAEDEATKGLDLPFRFGKSFDVNLTLKDGKWQKTDTTEVWGIKIASDNAYSLNFIFSELYLPKGGEMYIYNDDGSMVYGPVTEKQNNHGTTFLSDIIQGGCVMIQIYVPLKTKDKTKLTIQNVIHGYKNLFGSYQYEETGYGESASCIKDNDVACWTSWEEESDGIVQILLSTGFEFCSGALVNNTNLDYKPYILTAFHCIDCGDPLIRGDSDEDGELQQYEIDEAEEWLVRFGFKHTTCQGTTIGTVYTFDDTNLRAAWDSTDFALVELQDDILRDEPSVGEKVWLGWDNSGNTPTKAYCIHHPAGDVMKYSYDNVSPILTNYGGLNNSHWLVDDWTTGSTQGGSSGSPLFDQNKRIVGQDHAGEGSSDPCSPIKGTYFGSFSRSWIGDSTDATGLSHWLQPTGTGYP